MSEELKPCPFCGGEAEYSKVEKWESIPYGHEYHFVTCKNHCLEGLYARGNTKKETIKAWNNRPSPWHTGTPTEEGDFLLLVDKGMPRYTLGRWSGHWEFSNQDFVIAWQKIEPFKESE